MAEIATNMLHNVGNILNSVNVSAALVGPRLRGSKRPDLSRLVGSMNEHAADPGDLLTRDANGKLMLPYRQVLRLTSPAIVTDGGAITR
jgi:two-component system NtrC family sensor kinase